MKTAKKSVLTIFLVLCIVLCVTLSGCLTAEDYENIYNDDIKIATSSSNVRIGSVSSSKKIGSNVEYNMSCSSLSGVYIFISSFSVNAQTSVNLSLNVEEGKIKTVLSDGNSVYVLEEGSYDGALDLNGVPEGKYNLKLVGVEAKFNLKFTCGQ